MTERYQLEQTPATGHELRYDIVDTIAGTYPDQRIMATAVRTDPARLIVAALNRVAPGISAAILAGLIFK